MADAADNDEANGQRVRLVMWQIKRSNTLLMREIAALLRSHIEAVNCDDRSK